jgi:hypothetical protein
VLFLILHARLWVHWAPGIPHALCWAETKSKTRAIHAAGLRMLVIARSNATKQSSFLPFLRAKKAGLLRRKGSSQ